MTSIDLEQAHRIASEALARRRVHQFAPLAVAVLDARGVPRACLVEDDCSLLRHDIAIGKAASALNMGLGGRTLARRALENPVFFASLSDVAAGRMVPVRGSVLVRDARGNLLGAAGASGDTAANDELCLMEAITAAGLVADAGE